MGWLETLSCVDIEDYEGNAKAIPIWVKEDESNE